MASDWISVYIQIIKWAQLVLLWAQLTKIYPPLPTSVQPISIARTLLIVPTKNERGPPLFTGKLLIKFQNILRNTTQVIMRHRVKILFSVISSPTRKNCFRYVNLMSPLNAAICTTISYTLWVEWYYFKKQLFDLEVKGQCHTKVITVRDTPPYGHAPTCQMTYLERQMLWPGQENTI